MAYTLRAIRAWRTTALADVAEALVGKVESFDALLRSSERELDRLGGAWSGSAARAAEDRVGQEVRFGRRLSASIDVLERRLRRGDQRLWSVRETLLQKVAAAAGDGFSVSDDFTVSDPRTIEVDDLGALLELARRQAQLDGHAEAIEDALTTLTTEDRQVAFEIGNALDEVVATTGDVVAGREWMPPASPAGMEPREAQRLLADAAFLQWLGRHPDAGKQWLDEAVDAGLLAASDPLYETFLRGYWQSEALEAAGIDPITWDPSLGAQANAGTIAKVYEYYGRLFLDNPDLAWAGMANMIGPSFAGGFYDLDMLRDLAQQVEGGSEHMPHVPGGVDDGVREMLGIVAGLSDSEINYYQSTLLGMQKEIFSDQAAMHEAYLLGGPAEIDRMAEAGLLDDGTRQAWHDIASGDPELVERGNDRLLLREQRDIIADDYDQMRGHGVTGPAMTWMMTAVGTPSIPGAQGYADVYPEVIDLRTPQHVGPVPLPSVDAGDLVTPFPDGNVAVYEDRWRLIQEDTLPAYKDLLRSDPEAAREIVGSDFDGRVGDQRLLNRVDELAEHFITDWEYRR